jgi:hypothetical protein
VDKDLLNQQAWELIREFASKLGNPAPRGAELERLMQEVARVEAEASERRSEARRAETAERYRLEREAAEMGRASPQDPAKDEQPELAVDEARASVSLPLATFKFDPNGPSRQPTEWRELKHKCSQRFGFSVRMWTMRESSEAFAAAARWRETGMVEYPPYYDMMRVALETGDPRRLRPFTINGRSIKVD